MESFREKTPLEEFTAALERLIDNKPVNVAPGVQITRDSVALEAGRKKGSLRARDGYEALLNRIDTVANAKPKKRSFTPQEKSLVSNLKIENENLKHQLEILQSRNMSLLYQNFQMTKQLNGAGIEIRSFGEVVEFNTIIDKSDVR